MAGQQMQDLLLDVSRKLAGVERLLERMEEDASVSAEEIGGLRERLAALEATERERDRWNGEERRKVGDRLGSGDQTFALLRQQIKDAEALAEDCKKRLDNLKGTEVRKHGWAWFTEKAIEAAVPVAISTVLGLIWWGLIHVLLIGPKLAEVLKTVNPSGGHHP